MAKDPRDPVKSLARVRKQASCGSALARSQAPQKRRRISVTRATEHQAATRLEPTIRKEYRHRVYYCDRRQEGSPQPFCRRQRELRTQPTSSSSEKRLVNVHVALGSKRVSAS